MRCETAREHFSDLVEGAVDQALQLAIEHHFKVCPACTQEYEGFHHAWRLLDNIQWEDPPATLNARVMQAVDKIEALQPAHQIPAWRIAWQRLIQPTPVARGLRWSAAFLLLAGIAVHSLPGGVVRLMITSPIAISEHVARVPGLQDVQIVPKRLASDSEGSRWEIALRGPSKPVLVRAYTLDGTGQDTDWAPWMISSPSPVRGLKQIATLQMTGRFAQLPVVAGRTGEQGVTPVVIKLSATGQPDRFVAVWLPNNPELPAGTTTSANAADDLSTALWQLANDYQVAVVADVTDFSGGTFVSVPQGLDAAESLRQVARQFNLRVDSSASGVFSLTKDSR